MLWDQKWEKCSPPHCFMSAPIPETHGELVGPVWDTEHGLRIVQRQ